MQPVPSAAQYATRLDIGQQALRASRGKTLQPVQRAGDYATSAKRGGTQLDSALDNKC